MRLLRDHAAWLVAGLLAALTLGPLAVAWGQARDLGHGWAVPLLAAYLWWERWDARPPAVARELAGAVWWWGAGLIVLLAAPLRLLLTPFPQWPAALAIYAGLLAAVALGGAWLGAGSAGLRWVAGPLLLLPGALPWPSALDTVLIGPLRELLAKIAAEVCHLAGVPALAIGTSVRLAGSWVGVDETCGGMRSLQAGVTAALFFGEWLRLSWSRRIGLVAVGVAAAVGGNFLRIMLLTWRASVGGEAAVQAAHDVAGWLALGTSLSLTGLAAWRWRSSAPAVPRAPVGTRTPLPRVAVLWTAVPVLALAAVELGGRAWYRIGAARQWERGAQWDVRFPGREPGFRAKPMPEATRELLGPDFFSAGEWHDAQRRLHAAYYIEWHRGQTARFVPFLHNPTVCLPMAGCELVRGGGTLRVRWAGGELPFETHVFKRAGEEFAVGFVVWDPSRHRPLDRAAHARWIDWLRDRVDHVVEARADQPAQMLTVAVWGQESEARLGAAIEALVVSRVGQWGSR